MYSVDSINSNIPLFAIISENGKIILRTTDKEFAENITFFLNNEAEIFDFLDFSLSEINNKICDYCPEKNPCEGCRFSNMISSKERIENGLSRLKNPKNRKNDNQRL